jgi:gliding motility-associated-like protein
MRFFKPFTYIFLLKLILLTASVNGQLNSLAISISAVVNNISCNGLTDGSIDITISGATGPLFYAWSNGASSQDISNLSSGVYSVTVTEIGVSTATASYEIVEPDPINITINGVDPVTCFGGSDGAIYISITGGVTPYTFDWGSGYTYEDLLGMPAGNYTLNIMDFSGCDFNGTLQITQPSQPITLSMNIVDVTCNGGSDGIAVAVASGGMGGFTYIWSTLATTPNLLGMPAGTYSVTVTDTYGCSEIYSSTINQPSDAVSASSVLTDISCFGYNTGAISVIPAGGTAPYNYLWSISASGSTATGLVAGSYSYTVFDVNGCEYYETVQLNEPDSITITASLQHVLCFGDSTGGIALTVIGGETPYIFLWSNGEENESVTNLPVGMFGLSVTDGNDCVYSEEYEIEGPPSAIGFNFQITAASCTGVPDGYIVGDVDGGVTPYDYQWSNGNDSASVQGLVPALYTLTVTDGRGCVQIVNFDVPAADTLEIEPYSLNLDANFMLNCFQDKDGIIGFDVTDGNPPYTFLWNTGVSASSLEEVGQGNYVISVTDILGCFISDTIKVRHPEKLRINAHLNQPYCPEVRNGGIGLVIAGGTQPYYLMWNTLVSSLVLTDLGAGSYSVTVTDSRGCMIDDKYKLNFDYDECLTIPNVFTPNNDNYNDYFEIRGAELHPMISIEIFNAWGTRVYSTTPGEKIMWDGTYMGNHCPIDTYYCIIRLNSGFDPITGSILIKR